MSKGRLEAFSDGVIAILITIMVLELRPPHTSDLYSLREVLPSFLSYVLSFVFLGIYWNNHHHMLNVTERVNGAVLWANLHLLFWLSLVPFGTAWIGQNGRAAWPTALYGVLLTCAALSYEVLQTTIIRQQGRGSKLALAVGKDRKGKLSLLAYVSAIPLAFVEPVISDIIYIGLAAVWLVPDRRIEKGAARFEDRRRDP
jgi:uncharacterized membrane protein